MIVQVLHVVKDTTLGIVQSIGGKFLKNMALIPQDLCKEIGESAGNMSVGMVTTRNMSVGRAT